MHPARVKIEGPLCCHVWQGATSPRGYPVARVNGLVRQVRRMVYERHRRPLEPGEIVEMECENRLCVYEAHMVARYRVK